MPPTISAGPLDIHNQIMLEGPIQFLPRRNRSNYLSKCRNTTLGSNLFRISYDPTNTVSIFSISTQPEIPLENGKRFRSMLIGNPHLRKLVGSFVICGRTLFTNNSHLLTLKQELSTKIDFENQSFALKLRLVKQVSMSDLEDTDKKKSAVVFQFMNNMVRNFFYQMHYTEIGRSRKYFDPNNRQSIDGANVTLFRGYSTNFLQLENGLYCRIDPAVKIVRSESVLDIINSVYKKNNSLPRDEKRQMVEEELRGKMVMANYGKNNCYIIDSLVFNETVDSHKFEKDGKSTSISEYLNKTYDLNIQAKKQPLVKTLVEDKHSRQKKEVLLVPELLLMSGLPEDFDERKRKAVSDCTIVKPGEKLKEVEGFFKSLANNENSQNFNPRTISNALGIEISTEPAQIPAKQLSLPQLQLGKKDRIQSHKATCFSLFNKQIFSPTVPLKISSFYPNDFDFHQIKKLLDSTCRNLGLQYEVATHQLNFRDQRDTLNQIQKNIKKDCQSGTTNLFWFIVPPNFRSQYKELKKFTLATGVQTSSQVTLTTTFKKGFASVVTKVLLQMASKVGNTLWLPKVARQVEEAGVLLIGIETTADSFNSTRRIISYCANSRSNFSSFYSNYFYQKKDGTGHNQTRKIVFQCLSEFLKVNRSPPANLIIMKNGSVKLDLKLDLKIQIAEIEDIISSTMKGRSTTKLLYFLVDMNSSQKFFQHKGSEVVNPGSGILVNGGAVSGQGFDFYLVAQLVRRGTVKPTYYKAVYNDSQLEQGVIEELLYSQCFNYSNWSGSIKVPGVMQYAKKLGSFIGQHVNQESVSALQSNLYYI